MCKLELHEFILYTKYNFIHEQFFIRNAFIN